MELGSRSSKPEQRLEATGPRVALRPLTADDLAAVEPWYAEAARQIRGGEAEFGARDLRDQMEAAGASGRGGLLALARIVDPVVIGLLDYRVDEPDAGWLTVGFIALAAGQRGRGYGSEAVRLLEAEAESGRWARCFRAGVDVGNGLGLYFWLRLGYRPLAPGGQGWPVKRGIIWMVREEG